ncbi:MAG: hypothetical protein KDA68_23415, partial [Planctomycetaceae bacterium]|nr:hypothetical protein [Planctomycetaceae bacterium]
FHPHLTLARVKGPLSPSLRKLWLANQQTDFGPITIDSLTLFQSQLTPQSATYINLASIPLPRQHCPSTG